LQVEEDQIKMEKMLEAEIWTIVRTGPSMAVLLKPLGYQVSVPVFVGHREAQSILTGFGGTAGRRRRPATHDLMVELIRQMGFELVRVEIYDIKNSSFLSHLFFQGSTGQKSLTFDSAPSDAVALAVRCKCPIFIAQRIVIEVGVPEEFFLGVPEEAAPPPEELSGNSRRMALQAELEEALAQEAYERAATIRDMLILMDKEARPEFPGADEMS
jgi:bifunctional DNase/RNase